MTPMRRDGRRTLDPPGLRASVVTFEPVVSPGYRPRNRIHHLGERVAAVPGALTAVNSGAANFFPRWTRDDTIVMAPSEEGR